MVLKLLAARVVIVSLLIISTAKPNNQPNVIDDVDACVKRIKNKDIIFCVSVPKAGTHLLTKCINLLEIDGITYRRERNLRIKRKNKNQKLPHIINKMMNSDRRNYNAHCVYNVQTAELLKQVTKANFFVVRDPRAQILSLAFAVKRNRPLAKNISLECLLLDFICGRKQNFIPSIHHPKIKPDEYFMTVDLLWQLGVTEFYKLFLPWIKEDKFYTVKFENLVGPKGGGSAAAQETEIANIMKHLGIEPNRKKVANIVKNIFGGTETFRAGQIDGWKEYFTPEIKQAYKNMPGACELLIELGYEKDKNW